jgi:hypothetical protein
LHGSALGIHQALWELGFSKYYDIHIKRLTNTLALEMASIMLTKINYLDGGSFLIP